MAAKTKLQKIISLLLALTLFLPIVTHAETAGLPIPNEHIIVENVLTEGTINEQYLDETIIAENYLNEMILAENKISELLLEETVIEEVILCKTIYVTQDNIAEFAKNSQTDRLFGENIDLGPLLTKLAVGAGVIITLVVLKKHGFPDPIANIVISAADEALAGAGLGAGVGSLFGGMTGALQEIDPSGRLAAILGFATATAGFIIALVHLVGLVPSGGTSSIGVGLGIRIALAGIATLGAGAATISSGSNLIRKLTTADAMNIDWENIDWEKVGLNSVEQAINYGADGFMWGSIFGAIDGGAKELDYGLEYYHKYNTPYTDKEFRLDHTPKEGSRGKWTGERGESDFVLDEPLQCSNGTVANKATYKNAVPDFSEYEVAQVKVNNVTNYRPSNYRLADAELAKQWTKIQYLGKKWTRVEVSTYRTENGLTWHEMSNMQYMQLIPTEVNGTFTHCGGVTEYNAFIEQNGGIGFD